MSQPFNENQIERSDENLQIKATASPKPTIIGIYGVSGAGKTTILNDLKFQLPSNCFEFFEGSEVLAETVPGGLGAFHQLEEPEKYRYRELSIRKIASLCRRKSKTGVVTGHYMFWDTADETGREVCTESDLQIFTHIIYLNVSPNVLLNRRVADLARTRQDMSLDKISKWQQLELQNLRAVCRNRNMLFIAVNEDDINRGVIKRLILDFAEHNERHNAAIIEQELDYIATSSLRQAKTVLLLDGDRTIASQDTGSLFFEKWQASNSMGDSNPLKTLFGSLLGYSYNAFRQATLLYEECRNHVDYDKICREVASLIILHSGFLSLLHLVAQMPRIGVVLVSCGLKRVWELVLQQEDLHCSVTIIAGGSIDDKFVVSPESKAAIVSRLQSTYKKRVWAFGDSPLDLPMLQMADRAIVVVIDQKLRSKKMENALAVAIGSGKLRAHQYVLPDAGSPRLDTGRLPVVDITTIDFVNGMFNFSNRRTGFSILEVSHAASDLLATPMRDASISGPPLREAHERAGWYMVHEILPQITGLAPRPIAHVLGHSVNGSKILGEDRTTVIALMRGGESMAFGVSKALPQAMFVHIKDSQDLKSFHVEGQAQVILVDSVINTGKSIVECVQAIRALVPSIRIIIMAGVVQAECLIHGSYLDKELLAAKKVDIITLRISETKFTGSGTTDTGNRLFNTTHLA